jgi:hypothetical protein
MITQICTKCKAIKKIYEFYLDCRYKNHYLKICKDCVKEKSSKYYNKNIQYYNKIHKEYFIKNKRKIKMAAKKLHKTKKAKFPWIYTLKDINQRCNNNSRPYYKYYGGRGIQCLITAEELKELWFRDKAYEMKKPSIDRIDNDGNYEFNNCRYIEQGENTKKRIIDAKLKEKENIK